MTKIVIKTDGGPIPPDILNKYYTLKGTHLFFYAEYCEHINDGYHITYYFQFSPSDKLYKDAIYHVTGTDLGKYTEYFQDDVHIYLDDETRIDPIMISLVEHYKPERLKVISIPDDVEWKVDVPEGSSGEIIEEKHRTWS